MGKFARISNQGRLLKQVFYPALYLALMFSGCSTPPVPDQTQQEAYNNALSSYSNCRSMLRPYSYGDRCNSVSALSETGQSFNSYIYGSSQKSKSQSVSAAQALSVQTSGLAEIAWQSYLKTLSTAELQEMSLQWKQLASGAKGNDRL